MSTRLRDVLVRRDNNCRKSNDDRDVLFGTQDSRFFFNFGFCGGRVEGTTDFHRTIKNSIFINK